MLASPTQSGAPERLDGAAYFFAEDSAGAASGSGHTTDTIHATTIPTRHPNKTSPIRVAPAIKPFLRELCARLAAMTKAALIGACRHMRSEERRVGQERR